jgi:hypothetical protein
MYHDGDGYWIIHVIVPSDAKIIKDYNYAYTDKIIMGDRFPLYDLKTIKKFNLNITDVYISELCKRGKVNILEWLFDSGLELKYTSDALDWASCNGLDLASCNGHVNVLEWWKNSGLELQYTESALNWASENCHINVLEWWKNSGLELKYTESVLNSASENGHVGVLEWWKNSGSVK